MKRENKEYQLCKAVAYYLRMQYPKVIYHFDLTGLNLSVAQARMSKAIQHSKGWPDLFIAHHKTSAIKLSDTEYRGEILLGLFIELKAEGTRLTKRDGNWASPHIDEQAEMLDNLRNAGYMAEFACGFDEAKELIDNYLK